MHVYKLYIKYTYASVYKSRIILAVFRISLRYVNLNEPTDRPHTLSDYVREKKGKKKKVFQVLSCL